MAVLGAWSFNEDTGVTAADSSGNNKTMTNIPGWSLNGHTGSGMLSSGAVAGGRVVVPESFWMHETGTYMCWVRLNSLPASGQDIFSFPRAYYGDDGTIANVSAEGQLNVTVSGGGTIAISGPTLSTDQWYHVAIGIDWASGGSGRVCHLYLNGVQVGALTNSANVSPLADGFLYWGGNARPLDGIIDDARWYSEKLLPADIQTLMNTPVPGILESSGTTRFMKLQDGSWAPVRTQRIVGSGGASATYGWQLTKELAGLNKYGINGNRLPEYGGPIKPLAGTVIRRQRITSVLDLSNGNITLDTCYIKPKTGGGGYPILSTFDFNAAQPGAGPVTIRDCTIDGSALTPEQSAQSLALQVLGTVSGNYITGFGSGIAFMGVGTQSNGLVENNYVTGLTSWGNPATTGNHSDAFTVRDFSNSVEPARNLIVRNNRFDCNSGNDTGACFIQTSAGNIANVTLSGNLLEGGGYNFGLNQMGSFTYSNLVVTNNRFGPTGYGAASMSGGPGFATWSNNYLNADGQPDNQGAVVAAPVG